MKGKHVTFGPIHIKHVENISCFFERHDIDLHSIILNAMEEFHENKDKYEVNRKGFMSDTIIPCVHKLFLHKIPTSIDIHKFDIDEGSVRDLFQTIEVAFKTHRKINIIQSDRDMIVFYGNDSSKVVIIDKEANIVD